MSAAPEPAPPRRQPQPPAGASSAAASAVGAEVVGRAAAVQPGDCGAVAAASESCGSGLAGVFTVDQSEVETDLERMKGKRQHAFQVNALANRKERTSKVARRLEMSIVGAYLGNAHVWWRHPVARLVVPWLVLFQDLLIYGEDPLNDSYVEASYPGMGHVMGIMTFWAAPSFAAGFVRLLLTSVSIGLGVVAGRWLSHVVMRGWAQLSAFKGSEGLLFTVPLSAGILLLVSAVLYSSVMGDTIDGSSMEIFYALGAADLQYRTVAKYFQVLSLSVDFLAIAMISDQILQDLYYYPDWANYFKAWWMKKSGGWVRIVLSWVFLLSTVVAATVGVFSTGHSRDDIRWSVGGTTEAVRSFLVFLIIVTDLVTTVQDWDFPTFREPLAVDIPVLVMGTKWESLTLRLPCMSVIQAVGSQFRNTCLWERLPSADFFKMDIGGKWLSYGPLLGVMFVDLLCAKTQVMYAPEYYGQYADPRDGSIWTITDQNYLAQAYSRGTLLNETMVTFEARRDPTGQPLDASAESDVRLNEKYNGNFGASVCALLLSILAIVLFCALFKFADFHRAQLLEQAQRELLEHGKREKQSTRAGEDEFEGRCSGRELPPGDAAVLGAEGALGGAAARGGPPTPRLASGCSLFSEASTVHAAGAGRAASEGSRAVAATPTSRRARGPRALGLGGRTPPAAARTPSAPSTPHFKKQGQSASRLKKQGQSASETE